MLSRISDAMASETHMRDDRESPGYAGTPSHAGLVVRLYARTGHLMAKDNVSEADVEAPATVDSFSAAGRQPSQQAFVVTSSPLSGVVKC